jgi:hypothetical protein
MSEQDNVRIVQRAYEAFGRGDVETVLGLMDEHVEWVSPGPPDLPTAGTRRGRQQVAAFFQALTDVSEIQRFEPGTFVAQGDQVIVLGEETGRIKATGRVLELSWAHAFTFRDGRIARMVEYMDTSAIVAELRAAQTPT